MFAGLHNIKQAMLPDLAKVALCFSQATDVESIAQDLRAAEIEVVLDIQEQPGPSHHSLDASANIKGHICYRKSVCSKHSETTELVTQGTNPPVHHPSTSIINSLCRKSSVALVNRRNSNSNPPTPWA